MSGPLTGENDLQTKRARTSVSRRTSRAVEAPTWAALAARVETTDVCEPYGLDRLSPDAQMVATLHNVVAQISKSAQLFLTNGFLSAWSRDLSRALRRLGTPRARAMAVLHTEIVAIGRVACVREREPVYESDEHGQFDPVLEELAQRLEGVSQQVIALAPELRSDLAAYLDGKRSRPSKRPWPRAPRLTTAMLEAWG